METDHSISCQSPIVDSIQRPFVDWVIIKFRHRIEKDTTSICVPPETKIKILWTIADYVFMVERLADYSLYSMVSGQLVDSA
jgi:hypothetical protein